MKRALICTAFMLAAIPFQASAQADRLYNFYYKGSEFLTLGKRQQQAYVTGLSDAYNQAARLHSEDNQFIKCTIGRDDKQLAEVFRIWLEGHPTRQSEPAAVLFEQALIDTCD